MRNPRNDPRTGDVLEHVVSGERRTVVAHEGSAQVSYTAERISGASICSPEQWREWAQQTSILGLAGV
jgi:hypothetical protein